MGKKWQCLLPPLPCNGATVKLPKKNMWSEEAKKPASFSQPHFHAQHLGHWISHFSACRWAAWFRNTMISRWREAWVLLLALRSSCFCCCWMVLFLAWFFTCPCCLRNACRILNVESRWISGKSRYYIYWCWNIYVYIYTIWLFNSWPWKDPPIFNR